LLRSHSNNGSANAPQCYITLHYIILHLHGLPCKNYDSVPHEASELGILNYNSVPPIITHDASELGILNYNSVPPIITHDASELGILKFILFLCNVHAAFFCKLYSEAKFKIRYIGSDLGYKVWVSARACVCPLYAILQCQNIRGPEKTTLHSETCLNIMFNICYYRYAAGMLLITRKF
jgi:hypothetical protein